METREEQLLRWLKEAQSGRARAEAERDHERHNRRQQVGRKRDVHRRLEGLRAALKDALGSEAVSE